jgi:hypothetical protein
VLPSPKFQENAGASVQSTAVADAKKATRRGAVPEEGEAVAEHERVHEGAWVAVTSPVLVQVAPSAVAVIVQVYVPAVA